MPVSRTALAPFFRVLKTALGPQAATTKISIGGGLKLQMQNIREAKDIDVIIEGKAGGPLINRKKLRNEIVSLDGRFAVNLGGVCRVTYRDPVTKVITAINILSPEVTRFAPEGTILSLLREPFMDDDLPLVSSEEVVKMKLLAAPDRYDKNKALQDFDDTAALLKQGLTMTYKDNEEKADIKAALEEFLPTYLEREKDWSEQDWKNSLGFA